MLRNRHMKDDAETVRADLLRPEEAADPSFTAAWTSLCDDLAEENPFYAPWSLAPALAAYADTRVRLAVVWRGDILIGLVPVTPARGYARLPVGYWRNWTHPHCYFAAPLVRKNHTEIFFRALFDLLCEGDDKRGFLRLGRIDGEGQSTQSARLVAESEKRFCYQAGDAERALLTAGASAEATLAVFVRKKKRKELKRLRNRLDELGRVEIRQFGAGDDIGEWTQSFVDLEHCGWKGKKGTSLKANKKDAGWFSKTLEGAREAGQLHIVRIDVDEKPIAMLANFLANGAGYSVKICYDPEFARFSPGVMVEVEAMRFLLEKPDFRFMDSCAAPDHSMINGLWRSRRVITGLNISANGISSKLGLRICRALEGARARLQAPKT
ncbi:GNAT family N-acetyltransferase [Hyphococcus sp.]|uniref:GNAT family N-acetyltransferase n=1 Tax=Hyphococcus sp. TaxID=2038636 RepID=UPI003CCBBE87